jgi:hypothetical protein
VKVRNKLTGETADHVRNNNETIHTLVKLGVLEVVDDTPAPGEMVRAQNGALFPVSQPPATPRWYVGTFAGGGNDPQHIPCVVYEVGTTNYERFCGEPEDLRRGIAFGRRVVPADIVKEYEKAYQAHYKTSTKELLKAVVRAVKG